MEPRKLHGKPSQCRAQVWQNFFSSNPLRMGQSHKMQSPVRLQSLVVSFLPNRCSRLSKPSTCVASFSQQAARPPRAFVETARPTLTSRTMGITRFNTALAMWLEIITAKLMTGPRRVFAQTARPTLSDRTITVVDITKPNIALAMWLEIIMAQLMTGPPVARNTGSMRDMERGMAGSPAKPRG